MSFIRYDIGDVGVLTKKICSCGRTLLVLKDLMGRQQDALRNESGDKLSATFFAAKFRDLRHIEGIQLVQHDIQSVEILYTGNEERVIGELKAVTDAIRERLGHQMQVFVTNVEQIPITKRGKRLLIRGLKI